MSVRGGDWSAVTGGGYTATQTTSIDIIDDEEYELYAETFSVYLKATPGVTSQVAPSGRRAVVTINDNDQNLVLAATGVAVTSTPTNSYYSNGNTIEFTVSFNGKVTVTGAPRFAFSLGGPDPLCHLHERLRFDGAGLLLHAVKLRPNRKHGSG